MTSKAFRRTMMACLCIVLAFMYIPIIAIIGMSFNKTPYGMFPYVFTTQWYKTLFTTSNLLPACILSLKFSFLVTLAAVVIARSAPTACSTTPPSGRRGSTSCSSCRSSSRGS